MMCGQPYASVAHEEHTPDAPHHSNHLVPGAPWDAAMDAAVGTVHFKHHPPPVLYTIPGSGNTWVRVLIDRVLRSTSGSIYDDHEIAKSIPGERYCRDNMTGVHVHACLHACVVRAGMPPPPPSPPLLLYAARCCRYCCTPHAAARRIPHRTAHHRRAISSPRHAPPVDAGARGRCRGLARRAVIKAHCKYISSTGTAFDMLTDPTIKNEAFKDGQLRRRDKCHEDGGIDAFNAFIVVVREPTKSIWADYTRKKASEANKERRAAIEAKVEVARKEAVVKGGDPEEAAQMVKAREEKSLGNSHTSHILKAEFDATKFSSFCRWYSNAISKVCKNEYVKIRDTLPSDRRLFLRFEDLQDKTTRVAALRRMLEFITDDPFSDDAIREAFGHSDSFQRAEPDETQMTYEVSKRTK